MSAAEWTPGVPTTNPESPPDDPPCPVYRIAGDGAELAVWRADATGLPFRMFDRFAWPSPDAEAWLLCDDGTLLAVWRDDGRWTIAIEHYGRDATVRRDESGATTDVVDMHSTATVIGLCEQLARCEETK